MRPRYLTRLYASTLRHPLLRDAVHLHTLVAGCLLAFALVGRDPIPDRGSFRARVGALFAALAVHGILAKYLCIHATTRPAPPGSGTTGDWRLGPQVLWYGGDALEALLVSAFFAQCYRATGGQPRHAQRRAASSAPMPRAL